MTEEQASVDSLATAAIISEDPHAVLVEFSSVVADTQEYIIKVGATWRAGLREDVSSLKLLGRESVAAL